MNGENSIVIPVFKKSDKRDPKNYRRISFLILRYTLKSLI